MGVSGSGEEEPDRVVAGRYRLEGVLGRGGMGVVWRAVDTLIERTVALKELRPPAGLAGSDESSSFVERALREARNAGRLNHPSVVAVHDVIAPIDDDPVVYLVMEYVEAPSLAEVIDRHGHLPPARAAAMGLGILDALTAAHTMGIVHRDIKPGNVLVPDGDKVKLTDFGIALAAEDTRLTRSGVMGTQAYLAPECFDEGQVGPATDLWALGATLFHAVAGRAPFERATTTATLRAILFEPPPPPPCGPPLADAITGLLTRSVEQRLASGAARELLQRAATTAPTIDAPPTTDPGRATWQAQPTTHHHPPRPAPPPAPPHTTHPGGQQPWGPTTQPGGPPSPYVTAQHPPPTRPPTGPTFGPAPVGPPPQRNNTPLILGVVGAVAAALLLVVVLSSSGGSDDDDGGGGEQASGLPTVPELDLPDDEGGLGADTTDFGPTTTNSQGCCDGGAGAEALAQELLTAVRNGDEATAIATLCSDSDDATDITAAIAGYASLDIDPTTADTGGGNGFSASLLGTVDGEPITSGYVSVYPKTSEEGWCVYTFYAL
jgi:serine/threonine protein kinase